MVAVHSIILMKWFTGSGNNEILTAQGPAPVIMRWTQFNDFAPVRWDGITDCGIGEMKSFFAY